MKMNENTAILESGVVSDNFLATNSDVVITEYEYQFLLLQEEKSDIWL